MIVLSCSFPKSASTIFATYIEDLVSASHIRGGQDRMKTVLGGRYFDRVHPCLAVRLVYLNTMHGSVVVKSHCSPHRLVRWLTRTRQLKAVYIFRDPRDVVLSAMDHRKTRGGAAFSDFTDLPSGADRVIGWLKA